MAYEVQIPAFEGPFDLLLRLILTDEVDLWEVSLLGIVDAYLAEVDRIGHLDLDGATEFLLVAATLVELKARRLLPGPDDIDLDEELARFEERDVLLARLLDCKTFQGVCTLFADRMVAAGRSFPRVAGVEEPFASLAPDPLEWVTLERFVTAARRAMTPEPTPEVFTHHVAPIRVSVRDAIDTVLALLPDTGAVRFRDLTVGALNRLEVVVRFLAVLELYKQGTVDLFQPENFAELVVRPLAPDERVALDIQSLAEWGDEPDDREGVGCDRFTDVIDVRDEQSGVGDFEDPVRVGELR